MWRPGKGASFSKLRTPLLLLASSSRPPEAKKQKQRRVVRFMSNRFLPKYMREKESFSPGKAPQERMLPHKKGK
jgi:hypothetical protein